jgi:hypothetical protein
MNDSNLIALKPGQWNPDCGAYRMCLLEVCFEAFRIRCCEQHRQAVIVVQAKRHAQVFVAWQICATSQPGSSTASAIFRRTASRFHRNQLLPTPMNTTCTAAKAVVAAQTSDLLPSTTNVISKENSSEKIIMTASRATTLRRK